MVEAAEAYGPNRLATAGGGKEAVDPPESGGGGGGEGIATREEDREKK